MRAALPVVVAALATTGCLGTTCVGRDGALVEPRSEARVWADATPEEVARFPFLRDLLAEARARNASVERAMPAEEVLSAVRYFASKPGATWEHPEFDFVMLRHEGGFFMLATVRPHCGEI